MGQKKGNFVFSGTIQDIETKAPIEGASIFFSGLSIGARTDSSGHFSLSLPARSYGAVFRSLGYKYKTAKIDLKENIQISIYLEKSEQILDEVVISEEKSDANVSRTIMGVEKMSSNTLKKLPNLMGEADVIRSIMLLPGVSTVGEGASGFNVRGGNVDQNLVLLDGVPLFSTSHLFGFFTSFNADMVQDLSLYKGGIPSKYGGRASSVLDVRMKEGNFEKWQFQGGISPISSRLLIDGPLVKDKTSLIVGVRGSLSDFYLGYFPNPALQKSKADFYDVNFKLTHRIGKNQRISLSAYASYDGFKFAADTMYAWQTKTISLQHFALWRDWSHHFTAFASEYAYGIEGLKSGYEFIWRPSITQKTLREDLSLDLKQWGRSDFGVEFTSYRNDAGTFRPSTMNSVVNTFPMQTEYSREMSVYIGHSLPIYKRMSLDVGLRYAYYQLQGPQQFYRYKAGIPRAINTITDTLRFQSGDVVQSYGGFEPRLSLAIKLDTNTSIKIGFNRMQQFMHLLSNTMAVSPVDIWKNSNPYLPQQVADQYSIGIFRNFSNAQNAVFEASAEVYYKRLSNVIDYIDGAALYLNPTVETDLLVGEGRAYGAEFFLKKARGKRLTGWVSYTYARSFRLIEANGSQMSANFGKEFPANFDMPHNFKFVLNHRLSKRITFNANFTYTSGRPITYPNARYKVYAFNDLYDYGYANGIFPRPGLTPVTGGSSYTYLTGTNIQPLLDGYSSPSFTLRNQERIPYYMRLDIGFTIEPKEGKRWQGSWNFSIYNLFARENAYSIFFRSSTGLINQARTYQLSVLGAAIPSLTYNFKF
ncbi:TonB-dependent receptor [Aquirufa nivalisilvae]|uniref:TonB-dependent receptor n=1 Tax=Aquirufa nivalisilvae TaxID=2516557 RepID=UPI0022A989D5|nr:TonB-dependent receptor [Aquirufa nivalisilvae]MCZ2478897.1 TonB-dependent receptor [Aquirufa nivalisilvae]MCZ2483631.1 TonB-dependent receptor [Aquirufa nivalisilvae]